LERNKIRTIPAGLHEEDDNLHERHSVEKKEPKLRPVVGNVGKRYKSREGPKTLKPKLRTSRRTPVPEKGLNPPTFQRGRGGEKTQISQEDTRLGEER